MTQDLYRANTPKRFWRCISDFEQAHWDFAIKRALPILGIEDESTTLDHILTDTLGEGRFGDARWELGTAKRIYYHLKPILPRRLVLRMRQAFARISTNSNWLIEDRYVRFLWEVMRQLIETAQVESLPFIHFWPEGKRFAFVLTHDIESSEGLEFVPDLAEIEQELGFRSSFNFVPEKYPIDDELIADLRDRGFEIGIHGLKHDGKLFANKEMFSSRAERINRYLERYEAKGFRAPLTHRQPLWMQELQIEYDLSFFDNDPFEPIPGGTMSIWPFRIGNFIELPYTLLQDYVLVNVLGERSPQLWLQKVDFIEAHYGMVLLITHPDYLRDGDILNVYVDFLQAMKQKTDYWHELPGKVAEWWNIRSSAPDANFPGAFEAEIHLDEDDIVLRPREIERTGAF